MEIEKAIAYFKNMKERNFAVLNDFKKEIKMKKSIGNNNIDYNTSTYENRDEYYSLAIQALEKMKYFKNCKDCNCYDSQGECEKFGVEVDGDYDGCTFYEDWGDEQ